MKRIGLVVNPIAGIGGKVGLKGSDGEEIQRSALAQGAIPLAGERTVVAMRQLLPFRDTFELYAWHASMGADAAAQAGVESKVLGKTSLSCTSARDTLDAVRQMIKEQMDLILFAGGDGTARDVVSSMGQEIPVVGIPAGVKIHSAVYATSPRHAGDLVIAFLKGEVEFRLMEVMDLDEPSFRQGQISPRLFGYLKVPYLKRFLQGMKAPAPETEASSLESIAEEIRMHIKPGCVMILGPGSTTYAVAGQLGLDKTLLGVDAYLDSSTVAKDASEQNLLTLLRSGSPAMIIVTPIGGQGCIFGRGNQPISSQVIRRVGRQNIRIISTVEKLHSFLGEPFWVDTGDQELDEQLSGYMPVITGYRESVMVRIVA